MQAKFNILTKEELSHYSPPNWLVEDILQSGAFACLVGAPKIGKTFLGLDLALSIATGLPWQGRATQEGQVLYVAAEGSRGNLNLRCDAWAAAHDNATLNRVFLLPAPVQLADREEMDEFLTCVKAKEIEPVLVVFDTLARCFFDREENSAKEMGLLVRGVDRLRAELGSAVLLIHHSGREPGRERGSSAIRGAVDTLLLLTEGAYGLQLKCEMQKEADSCEPVFLCLKEVDLPDGQSSMVVSPSHATQKPSAVSAAGAAVLKKLFEAPDVPLSSAALREACGLTPRTAYRHFKKLWKDGLIEKVGEGNQVAYKLTEQGVAATATSLTIH